MKFVIFHGSFGSPEGNWFPELKERLEAFDQEVIVPKLPVEDWNTIKKDQITENQNLANWFKEFENVYKNLKKDDKVCFIGHSLGCVFILHLVSKYNIKLDSAIFVSPFMESLNGMWQIEIVNKTFYKKDFDFEKLKKLIPISYTLYSNNDPYVDSKYSLDFSKAINSSPILVSGAGHMNSEVNMNEFPLVYELCKTRIDLSLYQRYLEHRRELFAVQYIKGKTEEVIYLDPTHAVQDEGLFHFRNLRTEGFCTFLTGTDFWEAQSLYMQEARKAAKRMRNLTRVFVVSDISDLKKEKMRNQIKLDIEGGIKVYFCMLKDITEKVKSPDFGIWDSDYRCLVLFGKDCKPINVELSSRKKDIELANKWKAEVLKKSTKAEQISDLDLFIKNNS